MFYLIAGFVLAVVLGAGLLAAYQHQKRGAPAIEPSEFEPSKRYLIERRDSRDRVQQRWETDDSRQAADVIVQERDSGRRGAAFMDGKQIREW